MGGFTINKIDTRYPLKRDIGLFFTDHSPDFFPSAFFAAADHPPDRCASNSHPRDRRYFTVYLTTYLL